MTDDAIRVSPGRPTRGGSGNGTASDRDRDSGLGRVRAGRHTAGLPVPTELLVLGLLTVLLLIAAQVDDGFGARSVWLYVTILGAAYIVSRGLAKLGHRDH